MRNLRATFIATALFALSLINASSLFAGPRLNVRLYSDPVGFDWNIATTTADTYVLLNLMEGLVQFDNQMRVVPSLATHWDISPDRKTYTFHIRQGVRWSDGQMLTAQQFVDSWQRLLNPATGASYAYFLFDIEGAEDYSTGKNKDFSKVGIKALDQRRIQVKLKNSVNYFLSMFTYWVTFPIRTDLISLHGNSWTEPGKLVVLGPFNVESYTPQHEIILKRNPSYWGQRSNLDTVTFRIVPENSTAINLFRSKQLDFVAQVGLTELGDLTKTPEFHTAPYYRVHFLGFNTKKPPFDKVEVRRAFNMAIDRTGFAKVFKDTKIAAYTIVPPAIFPEGNNTTLKFDPAEAKRLLEKAGIKEPHVVQLSLVADSIEEYSIVTQYLQQQWKKHLGIEANIEMYEYKTFRNKNEMGDGSVFLRRWGADYPDPDNFYSMFLGGSGNNKTGWSNKEYDQLVTQARTEAPGIRGKSYRSAAEILLQKDCPVMPLYFDNHLYLLRNSVQNFRVSPLNYIFFKDVVLN